MRIQNILVLSLLFMCGTSCNAKAKSGGTHSNHPSVKLTVLPPTTFVGEWTTLKAPFITVTLTQTGSKLKGDYVSTYNGGRRVQTGDLEGVISKKTHAHVKYSSSFAYPVEPGFANLDLTPKGMKWSLVKPAGTEDYAPQMVLMKKVKRTVTI